MAKAKTSKSSKATSKAKTKFVRISEAEMKRAAEDFKDVVEENIRLRDANKHLEAKVRAPQDGQVPYAPKRLIDKLRDERTELEGKVSNLSRFTEDRNYEFREMLEGDKHLLKTQLCAMQGYLDALSARILRASAA